MNDKFSKPYNPKDVEEKIYKLWEESGFFNPDKLPNQEDREKKGKYTIMLPPPNVTGSLHMGHALNATIQDILIRKKRMEGYKTLWLPGTDHAGIATQNVVEKKLQKEGISRHDLGKEKFLEKIWEWKEEYGNKILDQLKKIGASCDWSRVRFTMDDGYKKAVEKAFLEYYNDGLIYQGERVINWCKRCQTSLSDLEIEYEEEKGNLYYIKYPLKEDNSKYVIVATTRPETMLGDTAVAVNLNDERYKNIIGSILILPIIGREISVIADELIDKEFGTGAVKITPNHSLVDSDIADRHNLPRITIIDKFGKMTVEAGKEFESLSVKDAKEKVILKLKELNFLEKTEDYIYRISKCYRCNSVIEPQSSKQWFLKMGELGKKAKEAVEENNPKIKFNDNKWKKIYLDWMSNVKDWCISRQIWWGHKIPIDGVDDVLDTWFSSALWPFATLGWPDKNSKDLKEFYPTQVLSTARDIITLWVGRMIFSSIKFMDGQIPFSNIIIHPTVLAKSGQRMSKSLGTGIDPLGLIEKYGADAVRFGLIYQMMGGQDIKFDESHLLAGKKFSNKLWNATRFALLNSVASEDYLQEINHNNLINECDKKIIKLLEEVKKNINKQIENFEFGQALHLLYDFFWYQFCDDYIENSKKQLNNKVLGYVLISLLKLLHPFMPFITEEIWSALPLKDKNMLIIEKWN